MKFPAVIVALSTLASASAHAEQDACGRIAEANRKTGSSHAQMKATGYAFAADTPGIYGLGVHTCSHLRDETVDGQTAAVYREQYQSKTGSTDAEIWISKTSGLLLREEQDGDVPGKGKGHIAYRWAPAATEPSRAAGSTVQENGKLPMYPRGRNLNDMPASAVERGVPMVLETGDSVTTVDAWYKFHVLGSCARSTADQGVKYACPAGSIMIYAHEGKTQIAFVPAMATSINRK